MLKKKDFIFWEVLLKIVKICVLIYLLAMLIIAIDGLRISQHWSHKQAKYAIVYWSKVESNWELSPGLKAKLDMALDLYRANEVERIIVSGGIWDSWYSEAEEMKKYLVNNGVKIPRIVVDEEWSNTMMTSHNAYAINKAQWNYPHVWIVAVSQFFHLPRVKLSLRNAWFIQIWAIAPEFFEPRDIYSLAREVPAYWKYLLNSFTARIDLSEEDLKKIGWKAVEKISEKIDY